MMWVSKYCSKKTCIVTPPGVRGDPRRARRAVRNHDERGAGARPWRLGPGDAPAGVRAEPLGEDLLVGPVLLDLLDVGVDRRAQGVRVLGEGDPVALARLDRTQDLQIGLRPLRVLGHGAVVD